MRRGRSIHSSHRTRLARHVMPKVFVVRHGETELNKANQIRGWRDVPLNEKGKADATKIAAQLASDPDSPQTVITSDLSRAHDTANAIAQTAGTPPPIVDPALRPWNVGNLTGVESKAAVGPLQDLIKTPDVPAPGGESFNDFKNRFLTALAGILAKAGPDDKLAIVTHHRGERLIDAFLKGGQDPNHIDQNAMMQEGIPPGSFIQYILSGAAKPQLE